MLTPSYYEHCTDDIISLYAELDNAIVSDVVRRLLKTGYITETAKWQIQQLQESGMLFDDIINQIGKHTGRSDAGLKKLFEQSGLQALQFDNEIMRLAGKSPIAIRENSQLLQILNAGYAKTNGNLQNLTLTTANASQSTYINACNNAYMQISSGAFDYQTAIRNAVKSAAQQGTHVLYDSGHTDKVDVAVRRSVLTGVGQTCRKLSETNAESMDCDLMEISAHSGARPSHAVWQGGIVSLSGRRGYLSKGDIGYGTGAGFGGWGCRHDWYPFFEGISKRAYSQSSLRSLNAKDIEYNGTKHTEYEITQMQRKYERDIRVLKCEAVAYDTAIKNSDNEIFKNAFTEDFNDVSARLKSAESRLSDFLEQTNMRRDRFREQIGGFNRSISSKATWASKKTVDKSLEHGKININADTIRSPEYNVNHKYIESKVFKDKFKGMFSGRKKLFSSGMSDVDNGVYEYAIKALSQNDGKSSETIFLLDAKDGSFIDEIRKSHFANKDDGVSEKLFAVKEKFILVHNHPNNTPLSVSDILAANSIENIDTVIAVGHDGAINMLAIGNGKRFITEGEQRRFTTLFNKTSSSVNGDTRYTLKLLADELGWKV